LPDFDARSVEDIGPARIFSNARGTARFAASTADRTRYAAAALEATGVETYLAGTLRLAAVNAGRNRRTIWTVFARRGLGASACGIDGNRSLPITSLTGVVHVSSFDLPGDLDTGARPPAGVQCPARGPAAAGFGRSYEFRNGEPIAGWILGGDGAAIARNRPVVAGEIITIHATGIGRVGGDGTAAAPVRVLIDNTEAESAGQWYSGWLRGGIYEIAARVPEGLSRKYPRVRLSSGAGDSNIVSAGGPSIARVTPAEVRVGEHATVVLTGVNFAPSTPVLVGDSPIAAEVDDAGSRITVTIPAAMLAAEGAIPIRVADANAPGEEPRNTATITAGR
jgi:hypothetical protein